MVDNFNASVKLLNKTLCDKYNLDFNIYDNLGCFDTSASIKKFKANTILYSKFFLSKLIFFRKSNAPEN